MTRISIPTAEFEPAITAIKQLKTHALNIKTTEIGGKGKGEVLPITGHEGPEGE